MTWTERNNGLKDAGWWLAAGITNADVAAVYQAIAARSQAESYWNLANPGVNDAAPGTAPTWAASSGWTFNGSSQFLTTGITAGQSYTVLVRAQYTAAIASAAGIVSERGTNSEFAITASVTALPGPNYRPAYTFRWANGTRTHSPGGGGNPEDDVIGLAGSTPYYIGSALTAVSGTWAGTPIDFFIGANNVGGAPANYFQGNVLAVAIYTTTLTAAQVSTITDAMEALTSSSTPNAALRVNYIVQHPATKRLSSTSHELLIATDDGIYRSFNGGREWAKIILPDPSNAEFSDSPAAVVGDLVFDWVAYDPTDSTILYARGTKSSVSRMWIYKSTDDGLNWSSRGVVAT